MTLTAEKLTTFLKETLNVEGDVAPSTTLFSSAMLDSVAMMNVIGYVEEVASITVHPGDVTLDNFDTIERIVQYVQDQD